MSADAEPVAGSRPRWLGVAGWTILILVTGLLPLPTGEPPRFGPLGPDKLLHLVAHAGLAGSIVGALSERRGYRAGVFVVAVAASVAYGVGIEYLQESIPGRGFEAADVMADAIGSVAGAVAWRYLDGWLPRPIRGQVSGTGAESLRSPPASPGGASATARGSRTRT